ncbi:heat shock protein 70 [Calocera cornea HHB12733]|uniref:non-chaperonin molecular chaperone ATPase n=1 Tax=Calocera cornea HHB12733 TaxID=1353952 RepID=A0A165C5N6_9BASI|nr:heat shock protein 70 [Calocera cornea HHB12733]
MSRNIFRVLGIDLGTTWCCVAAIDHDNGDAAVEIALQGNRTTPSFIVFTNEKILVGEQAMAAAAFDDKSAANTVFDIKRVIGRRFSDPSSDSSASATRRTPSTLAEDIKLLLYSIVNRDDYPVIQVEYRGEKKEYTPQECSAFLLRKFKIGMCEYYGGPLLGAVVTVPVYFTEAQRGATKGACILAGLNMLQMINELTAAAIAHGLATRCTRLRSRRWHIRCLLDAHSE